MLIFLICGISFPYQYLPGFLKVISKLIPVTDGVIMIRNSTLLGMGIRQQLHSIIYLLILSLVYTIIGFKLMNKIERIALEKIEA
jgi:ABC-2 type transport system permease protein